MNQGRTLDAQRGDQAPRVQPNAAWFASPDGPVSTTKSRLPAGIEIDAAEVQELEGDAIVHTIAGGFDERLWPAASVERHGSPLAPGAPSFPSAPFGPGAPSAPFGPSAPAAPCGPVAPTGPAGPAGPFWLNVMGVSSFATHWLVASTIRRIPPSFPYRKLGIRSRTELARVVAAAS